MCNNFFRFFRKNLNFDNFYFIGCFIFILDKFYIYICFKYLNFYLMIIIIMIRKSERGLLVYIYSVLVLFMMLFLGLIFRLLNCGYILII